MTEALGETCTAPLLGIVRVAEEALASADIVSSEREPRPPDEHLGDPDGELMLRIAGGEEEAFEQLLERFRARLRVAVDRILHDRERTEDVLQETFIQAWRQAERFDPRRGSVSTWLGMIARARALDRYRALNNGRRIGHLLAWTQSGLAEHGASPQGEGNVLRSERRSRLGRELGEIPDAQRAVLRLAYFEGLTQSEIAERLGIPLGTVKTRSRQGLRKLRRRLNGDSVDLL